MRINILAVSDTPSKSLELAVSGGPSALPGIDLVLSCGDLRPGYLELLADGLNHRLLYVSGNHYASSPLDDFGTHRLMDNLDAGPVGWRRDALDAGTGVVRREEGRRIAGQLDLHGRIETFQDFLVVGFGGCRWYGGKNNEFTEPEMRLFVKKMIRKISWFRLKSRFKRQAPRPVIVISHAPPAGVHDRPDPCHTGFSCFHELIDRIEPVLWIHGHIHRPEMHEIQSSTVGKTTVINAHGHKYITIRSEGIEVSYKPDIFLK